MEIPLDFRAGREVSASGVTLGFFLRKNFSSQVEIRQFEFSTCSNLIGTPLRRNFVSRGIVGELDTSSRDRSASSWLVGFFFNIFSKNRLPFKMTRFSRKLVVRKDAPRKPRRHRGFGIRSFLEVLLRKNRSDTLRRSVFEGLPFIPWGTGVLEDGVCAFYVKCRSIKNASCGTLVLLNIFLATSKIAGSRIPDFESRSGGDFGPPNLAPRDRWAPLRYSVLLSCFIRLGYYRNRKN